MEYTFGEVKKHNKKEDGWVIIYGNIYNITDWIDNHPGGDIIISALGSDATDIFEKTGHLKGSLEHIEEYKIGKKK